MQYIERNKVQETGTHAPVGKSVFFWILSISKLDIQLDSLEKYVEWWSTSTPVIDGTDEEGNWRTQGFKIRVAD